MDVRFKNDSVFMVAGPSSSGKTVFVQKLLQHSNTLFKNKINNIHWYYGIIPPPSMMELQIRLHQGLSEGWSEIIEPMDVIVLDDLFVEAGNNKEVTNAFTRLAHHKPCTLIYITQNVFHRGNDARTRSLNTHYLVLMKNPRDASQISYLARQMYPKNSKFLTDVYRDVCDNEAFSYILLDFHQETPSKLRVRSNIFPGEAYSVYVNNQL